MKDIERVINALLANKSVKEIKLIKENDNLLIEPTDGNDLFGNECILNKYPLNEKGNLLIDDVIVRKVGMNKYDKKIKVIENEEEYFEDIEHKKRKILNYLKFIKNTNKKLDLSKVDKTIMDLLCTEDGIRLVDFSKETYGDTAHYLFEYNDEPLALKVTFDKASMNKEKPYVFIENIEFIE